MKCGALISRQPGVSAAVASAASINAPGGGRAQAAAASASEPEVPAMEGFLRINGQERSLDLDTRTTLLDVLPRVKAGNPAQRSIDHHENQRMEDSRLRGPHCSRPR